MTVITNKFAEELAEKDMRDAYLDAQTRAKLAQQIRALRSQRGWSQEELGRIMGKPQANIHRLEDRQVARYTVSTLIELASAFDVALVAKFVTYEDFLRDTGDLTQAALSVQSFSQKALDTLLEPLSAVTDIQFLNDFANVVSYGPQVNSSGIMLTVDGLQHFTNYDFTFANAISGLNPTNLGISAVGSHLRTISAVDPKIYSVALPHYRDTSNETAHLRSRLATAEKERDKALARVRQLERLLLAASDTNKANDMEVLTPAFSFPRANKVEVMQ